MLCTKGGELRCTKGGEVLCTKGGEVRCTTGGEVLCTSSRWTVARSAVYPGYTGLWAAVHCREGCEVA